jgi:hypothetical protein
MKLDEIYEAIKSDENFTRYIESDGEGSETAMTIDLILETVNMDGEWLADYEMLEIIKDISTRHTKYMEGAA